jgi:hypothetical protein
MQPVRGLEERPRLRREPPTQTGAGRRTGFGAPFGTVGATKNLPKPFRQSKNAPAPVSTKRPCRRLGMATLR